jgi:hypothetical protein
MPATILKRSGPVLSRTLALAALVVSVGLLAGCEPEVGTKAWCDKMDGKPKGDWTANQAGDYAKNCVFGTPKS